MANISYITPIYNTEHIGDSLIKINNNFFNLQYVLCGIKDRLETNVNVRTFFYYGPNSAGGVSGAPSNSTSRPSDSTISTFVNTTLNVPAISKKNDIAYVIFQKTGYQMSQTTRITTGVATAVVNENPDTLISYDAQTPDVYTTYAPTFITWKLTYNGTSFTVNEGFPKFTQGETPSTNDWKNPENWARSY